MVRGAKGFWGFWGFWDLVVPRLVGMWAWDASDKSRGWFSLGLGMTYLSLYFPLSVFLSLLCLSRSLSLCLVSLSLSLFYVSLALSIYINIEIHVYIYTRICDMYIYTHTSLSPYKYIYIYIYRIRSNKLVKENWGGGSWLAHLNSLGLACIYCIVIYIYMGTYR